MWQELLSPPRHSLFSHFFLILWITSCTIRTFQWWEEQCRKYCQHSWFQANWTESLHDFPINDPGCYEDVYVSRFFSPTDSLWNSLPAECFLWTYNLNDFKSRVNKHPASLAYIDVLKKIKGNVKKVGHTSEFIFGTYWWTGKTTIY